MFFENDRIELVVGVEVEVQAEGGVVVVVVIVVIVIEVMVIVIVVIVESCGGMGEAMYIINQPRVSEPSSQAFGSVGKLRDPQTLTQL